MIWVEQLSHHNKVASRVRFDQDSILIGRGYGSDLLLDEEHVASEHARIFQDDDNMLVVEDLGSINGVFDHTGRRHKRIQLNGNTVFRIGSVLLRVRSPAYSVAAETPFRKNSWLALWILPLTVLFLGCGILDNWMRETDEYTISSYILMSASLSFALFLFIMLWGFVSKLFSGKANFVRHAVNALGGFTLLMVLTWLLNWGSYAFSSRFLSTFGFVPLLLLFFVICYRHLYIISPQRNRTKLAALPALFVVTTSLLLISKDIFNPFDDSPDGKAVDPYLSQLFPPYTRMISPLPINDFFVEVQDMQGQLELLRKEKAPEEDAFFDEEM